MKLGQPLQKKKKTAHSTLFFSGFNWFTERFLGSKMVD